MAGYRPKNLDELNNMFDKTLAAERAIKKGTSLVEKTSENAILDNLTEDIERIAEEVKQSMGISEEINDFISKYSQEEPKEEEKADSKPKPQMTVLVSEQPKAEKASFELFENTAEAEAAAAEENPKADRSNLMDEYMRIMNDEEDDEIPQKKLSRKEKKKLKMMEKREAEKAAQQKEEADEPVAEPEAEVIAEAAPAEEPESFYDIADNTAEEDTAVRTGYDLSSVEEEFKAPEYVSLSPEPGEPHITFQENEAENDFDFPQDYTPAWMKDENDEEPVKPKKAKKENKASNHVFLKALLSLVLAVLIFIGSTATVFKTLIPVNTGKAVSDTFCFFTAYKDYTDLNIKKGDLIITENRYTQDGDVFAYVDYSNKSFEFGKRSDSITNDDGVVLLVTENQGSRTLVSRDDCKGVIYAVYPTIGAFIGILSDNFIIIIAAVAVSALVIILTLALALRNKEKSKKTKANKKVPSKKAVREPDEEPEIEELEEIDLFTTIG